MRSLEEKLLAVEDLFRRGSKGHQCAIDIILKGRPVSVDEMALIAQKIGCSLKTVEGVLTRLRKAGLYSSRDEPLTPEKPEKPKQVEPEKPKEVEGKPEEPRIPPKDKPTPKEEPSPPKIEAEEPEERYVTIDQFNQLLSEIKALAGIQPIQEPEDVDDFDYEEEYEAPTPESVDLKKASMKQMGTWVEAKNLIYFDFACNGAFGGALEDFDGNWSDFVNIVLDDYFRNACTRDGPCKYRMNIGLGLLSKRFA